MLKACHYFFVHIIRNLCGWTTLDGHAVIANLLKFCLHWARKIVRTLFKLACNGPPFLFQHILPKGKPCHLPISAIKQGGLCPIYFWGDYRLHHDRDSGPIVYRLRLVSCLISGPKFEMPLASLENSYSLQLGH